MAQPAPGAVYPPQPYPTAYPAAAPAGYPAQPMPTAYPAAYGGVPYGAPQVSTCVFKSVCVYVCVCMCV